MYVTPDAKIAAREDAEIAGKAILYTALAVCGARIAIHVSPPRQDQERAKILGALLGLGSAYFVNKKIWNTT